MNFIYNNVKKIATGKWVILLFFLFIVSFTMMNGDIIGEKKMMEYSNGIGILDKEFNYTPEKAYDILDSQGEQGREMYKDLIIYQDFLFPIIYTLFWLSLITYLFSKWFKNEKIIKLISLIPLLGGVFDWLENISILNMLINYPSKAYNLAALANTFTTIKTTIFMINIIIVIIGFIGMLLNAMHMKKRN